MMRDEEEEKMDRECKMMTNTNTNTDPHICIHFNSIFHSHSPHHHFKFPCFPHYALSSFFSLILSLLPPLYFDLLYLFFTISFFLNWKPTFEVCFCITFSFLSSNITTFLNLTLWKKISKVDSNVLTYMESINYFCYYVFDY